MDLVLKLSNIESDLITACIAKESWAQQRLYEMHYPQLMAVCLRYASHQDEALDLLHEGFIKIFRNLHKYQTNTSLLSWMKTILINTAIDHLRKMAKHRTEEIDSVYSLEAKNVDVNAQINEQDILKCIQVLTPAYRSVFNLYVIEGYSHKEIGDLLGITESTSRSNLVKARTKLKEMLKSSFFDDNIDE